MDSPAASRPPVVGLLFDNFGPYHLARLRGAQPVFAPQARFVGLQMFATSAEYLWQPEPASREGLELQTVLPMRMSGKASLVERIRGLWRHLESLQPGALIIAGYAAPEMLAAMAWCRLRGRTAVLISDSKEDDAPRSFAKEWLKGWLVRRFHAALTAGKPHTRYIVKLGFPQQGIFSGVNVVGNANYAPSRTAALPRLVTGPYFLMVNRFVEKKNLAFALDCYAEYRRQLAAENTEPWDLVLAGDGALRAQLEAQVLALGVREHVHFPGFLQETALLQYLGHCEVFVHASTVEQWGLVVNEAMAAGRPTFISRRCGCFEDLIIEGKTGMGFDPIKAEELISLLLRATRGQLPLADLGAGALSHIDHFSPTHFGEAARAAIAFGDTRNRGHSSF